MTEHLEQDRVYRTYRGVVRRVAGKVARRFRDVVEAGDIEQELWVYLFDRLDWLRALEEARTPEGVEWKLQLRLTDVARGVALKAKAESIGAKPEDMAFYTREQVRDLLPAALDHEQWALRGAGEDAERRAPSRPDQAGNRLATLADVSAGFYALPPEDQAALRTVYVDGTHDDSEDPEAVWRLANRALGRLVRKLGGPPPIWPAGRKAMSNAQAQALTAKGF